MRYFIYIGRRIPWLTLAVGILGGVAAWLVLPSPPRMTIQGVGLWDNGGGPQLAFSRDGRFVASTHGSSGGGLDQGWRWQGELRVWDTHEQRLLFVIPYEEIYPPHTTGAFSGTFRPTEPFYSLAFTPEGDKLIQFSRGKAQFHLVPSGAAWEPETKHAFPCDGQRLTSRLMTVAAGNPFVLICDNQEKRITTRDLWTAKEIGVWDVNRGASWYDLGSVMLEESEEKPGQRVLRVRELPSGNLHPPLREGADLGRMRPGRPGPGDPEHFAATPDGGTVVAVDGLIHVWRDGTHKDLTLFATSSPDISPDGQMLAAWIPGGDRVDAWPWARRPELRVQLTRLGAGLQDAFTIYDLTTGRALVHLPRAASVRFSLEGKTLAVVNNRPLDSNFQVVGEPSLDLYDLPLGAPWGKIVSVALVCASIVFVAGQSLRWLRRIRKASAEVPPPTPG